jgi:hypothetical protein
MHVASTRATAAPAKASDDGIDRVRKRFAKLVASAEKKPSGEDGGHGDRIAGARALGEALVGRSLTRQELRALVAPARDAAMRFAAHGDTERAMRSVALGLALLPGHPELMVVAGCVLAERGDVDEAMRAIPAAIEALLVVLPTPPLPEVTTITLAI